jgi:tRNA threonylcarbamoyl adenosine modification protein YeaZ
VSRRVLALDTATEVTAVAIGRHGIGGLEVLASCDTVAPRAAMSRLLPCIEDLHAALGLSPADLDEIVVGLGPGSFTGVRIGVATAKGIAQGLGVPLHGVGTLDAIAWRVALDKGGFEDSDRPEFTLGVVGDAMRGEVYPARFRIAHGVAQRVDDDSVAKPEAVIAEWLHAGDRLVLAGNGLRKYAERFAEDLGSLVTFAPEGLWAPSGVGLLAAYQAAFEGGMLGSGDAGALLPVYTRLSDAEQAEADRTVHGGPVAVAGASDPAPPTTGVRGPLPGGRPGRGGGAPS